ncbi:MAG: phosphatidate cytidylyltransferase [Gammaproteobacteria bacterium]
MLKQRIITASVLGTLIVFAIFKLPTSVVAFMFAVVTLIGAWEWSSMVGADTVLKKVLYLFLVGVSILLIELFIRLEYKYTILFVASIWWSGVVIMLALYRAEWLDSGVLQKLLKYSGFIVLIPAWLALVMLHKQSPAMLMFLLAIIWVADIAAYFTGKRYGKNKLAPELSPGKSREGVLGAFLASIVLALAGLQFFEISKPYWAYFIILCVVIALISVVGDLYESLLKRKAGVKDSGTILPGHGGVLDRIDSITAAAPGFVLGLSWICIDCGVG